MTREGEEYTGRINDANELENCNRRRFRKQKPQIDLLLLNRLARMENLLDPARYLCQMHK